MKLISIILLAYEHCVLPLIVSIKTTTNTMNAPESSPARKGDKGWIKTPTKTRIYAYSILGLHITIPNQ